MVEEWVKAAFAEATGKTFIPSIGQECLLVSVYPGNNAESRRRYPTRDAKGEYVGWRDLNPPERVIVVGGEYWGTDGLSNFWDWKVVGGDGERLCGYASFAPLPSAPPDSGGPS